MSLLLSPTAIRGVTLRNRCVLAPMQMYTAIDGHAQRWHEDHLGRFASGGFGLVFTEAMAVQASARATPGDLGAWSDAHTAGLRTLADQVHAHSAAVAVQLWHAGPKSGKGVPHESLALAAATGALSDALRPVGPMEAPATADGPSTLALTAVDIAEVVASFGQAARRCAEAAVDVLEIHAAHGYLLHAFLSPAMNRRTDAYGGSAENRLRFLREIVQEVRVHWPADRPLFVRLSCLDESDPYWTMKDTVALAHDLAAWGVDVVDCSSGGLSGALSTAARRPARHEGFQVPFASEIRRSAPVRTMAVGLITRARHAEQILADGHCDLVCIGRQALYDVQWCTHAAFELLGEPQGYASLPAQYQPWLRHRLQQGLWKPPADRETPAAHDHGR